MAKDINPNSRSPFVDSRGGLSKYGMDVILKVYRTLRFTGEQSAIDTIDTDLTGIISDIADNEAAITAQASQIATLQDEVALIGDYPFVTTAGDYTSTGRAFINVTATGVTITLNAIPENGEQVIVHRNTGSAGGFIDVTDGTGIDRIGVDQTTISYRYSTSLNDWVRGG